MLRFILWHEGRDVSDILGFCDTWGVTTDLAQLQICPYSYIHYKGCWFTCNTHTWSSTLFIILVVVVVVSLWMSLIQLYPLGIRERMRGSLEESQGCRSSFISYLDGCGLLISTHYSMENCHTMKLARKQKAKHQP